MLKPTWYRYLHSLAESRTLRRTATQGGLLRLTARRLTFGMGFLGAREIWCLELADIDAITLQTAATGQGVILQI